MPQKLGRAFFKRFRSSQAGHARKHTVCPHRQKSVGDSQLYLSDTTSTSGLRSRHKAEGLGDEEAPLAAPRHFQEEAEHRALECLCSRGFRPSPRVFARGGTSSKAVNADYEQVDENLSGLTLEEKAQTIMAARDKYAAEKKAELGHEFDEEKEMTQYVKDRLLKVGSNSELLMAAQILIKDPWTSDVDALPGNIYRLGVMGALIGDFRGQPFIKQVRTLAKFIGIVTIVMTQLSGPPMIFLSRMYGIGVLANNGYQWQCCPWHPLFNANSTQICNYMNTPARDVSVFDDWRHIASTKMLGMLMLGTFILNGFFVLMGEMHSWRKIYDTFRYLDYQNDKLVLTGMHYMYADALINSWVICWCCVDVYLVIGAASCPQDVVLNALSLLFLYNLDDIGGDLGFLSDDDWPGSRMAWIHEEIVKPASKTGEANWSKADMGFLGKMTMFVYYSTLFILGILTVLVPILAACTPFIQIVPG